MRIPIIIVIGVTLSFLLPALALQALYGPSYGLLQGEDCWLPDGDGGWTPHGTPSQPQPDEPSVLLPFYMNYLPYVSSVLFLVVAFRRLKPRKRP